MVSNLHHLVYLTLSASFFVTTLAIPASSKDEITVVKSTTMSDTLKTALAGNYSAMMEALLTAKLLDSFAPMTPMTLLCMPNDIFSRAITMNDTTTGTPINGSVNTMKKFLARYIILQRVQTADIVNDMILVSACGEKLRFNVYGKIMTVNGAVMQMEPSNNATRNLAIYRLNRSIMPSRGSGMISLLNARKDRFTTFIKAAQTAGVADVLEQGGPLTLFVPTNEAFKAMPDGALNKLMANSTELKATLLSHLASGSYFMPGLSNGTEIQTLSGRKLKIATNGTQITVGGARIVNDMNMTFSVVDNGVLYVINRVLMSRSEEEEEE